MSFAIRSKEQPQAGYEKVPSSVQSSGANKENASKAQLNIAEYDGVLMAALLFFHLHKSSGVIFTVISIALPLSQAIYFWGRVATGAVMPCGPIGVLPRYIAMGMMIFELYTIVAGDKSGQAEAGYGALAILALSLAAKLFMSFGKAAGLSGDKLENASRAQLNVAEYEGIFLASLLFLYFTNSHNLCTKIVAYACPISQAIYFWGRVLTGTPMPFSPLGALPRYIATGILVYTLLTSVNPDLKHVSFGPGISAVVTLLLSLMAKMFMTFARSLGLSEGKFENASKAQLNAAEYDGPFLAWLLFFHIQKTSGALMMFVAVVCPLAQFLYFFGRVATGSPMPFSVIGALPRYFALMVVIYLGYKAVA